MIEVRHWPNGNIRRLLVKNEAGVPHNTNGPAYQAWHENGQEDDRRYIVDGKFHRLDGPSEQEWYENGQEKLRRYRVDDKRHRLDGPADQMWHANGEKLYVGYYVDGMRHNPLGPAVQWWYGDGQEEVRSYWVEGKPHRIGGPSSISWDSSGRVGHYAYNVNGKCHNLEGPAVVTHWWEEGWPTDTKYFVDDEQYTEEEFKNIQAPVEVVCGGKKTELPKYLVLRLGITTKTKPVRKVVARAIKLGLVNKPKTTRRTKCPTK